MQRFRFLQLSDLHFGAPMDSSRLNLPGEKLAERKKAFEALVQSLPQQAKQLGVDVILLPGDLWDQEKVYRYETEQFRLLYDALVNCAPIPVVIAPGNHDYYSPNSFYHPQRLKQLGFSPWPDHIVIFDTPEFKRLPLPGFETQVYVTGRAFKENLEHMPDSPENTRRPLASLSPVEPNDPAIHIMLYHGANDDRVPDKGKLTAPFNLAELVHLNFDYAAIGHYHTSQEFRDMNGRILGAYAGCPFPRGLDETGEKHALLGEIIKTPGQPTQVTLQKALVADSKIVKVSFTVTGQPTEEDLKTSLKGHLDSIAQAQDIVHCELTGTLDMIDAPNWETFGQDLGKTFFHLTLDTRQVQPAYDIASILQEPDSLQARFIQHLEALEADADVKQLALAIGLDALMDREVRHP